MIDGADHQAAFRTGFRAYVCKILYTGAAVVLVPLLVLVLVLVSITMMQLRILIEIVTISSDDRDVAIEFGVDSGRRLWGKTDHLLCSRKAFVDERLDFRRPQRIGQVFDRSASLRAAAHRFIGRRTTRRDRARSVIDDNRVIKLCHAMVRIGDRNAVERDSADRFPLGETLIAFRRPMRRRTGTRTVNLDRGEWRQEVIDDCLGRDLSNVCERQDTHNGQ